MHYLDDALKEMIGSMYNVLFKLAPPLTRCNLAFQLDNLEVYCHFCLLEDEIVNTVVLKLAHLTRRVISNLSYM